MTTQALSVRHVAIRTGNLFTRAAAVVFGLAFMTLGLGLMMTVVILPAGFSIGLLGTAMFLGGLFAPLGIRR